MGKYNLDSDYQSTHKQEGGSVAAATKTRQCHLKPTALLTRQTDGVGWDGAVRRGTVRMLAASASHRPLLGWGNISPLVGHGGAPRCFR